MGEQFEFGEFRVDPGKRLLLRGRLPVPLTSKAFDTLFLLVTRQGQVLDKRELMETLWPDTAVEENNLNQNISAVRRALGELPGENRYIATVPGKGYCFTAEVRSRKAVATEPEPEHIRLAVLPFENLGGGPEREYLADGLTEETIATIGQIDPEHVSVIGRTSMMAYKRQVKSVAEIGSELDAQYLLESSIRAEGERLRVTTRLLRVHNQSQIWSASFDSEPSSLLALQRELSVAIAEQVRMRLSPARLTAMARRQTQNPEAYDLYLRGRYFWNQFTPPTTRRAIEYFTHAVELDDDYALAWSGMADALCSSPVTGDMPPLGLLSRAREAAEKALRSDSRQTETLASMGFFCFWLGWEWCRAQALFRQAISVDPNYAFAHRMLGITSSHLGEHDQAMRSIQRARELDPLSAMNRALSAQIEFAAKDLQGAVRYAQEAMVIDPEFWIGPFQLGQAYVALGRDEEAIGLLIHSARLSGGNTKPLSLRGYVLAKQGKRAEAEAVLRELTAMSEQRYVPPYVLALVQTALGLHELALDSLEKAFEMHDVHLAFLSIDPKWDHLRGERRFIELLSKCDFAR